MVLHNRSPFEHIELGFKDKWITILSAVNGGGKTTILSYIADALYEIARITFQNEFEGKENKYYRLSSSIFNMDISKPSYVSIQFSFDDKTIEYLDLRGTVSKENYELLFSDDYAIKFEQIKYALENNGNVKHISEQDLKVLRSVFVSNLVTFFPAYRHEQPGYLNDPYKIILDYGIITGFSGMLLNPIEVITALPRLANWLMDVVLDLSISQGNTLVQTLFQNINDVFSAALSIKGNKPLSLGIGQRHEGAARIQIGERNATGNWVRCVYPSIFNMSSGENALICLFCELVRQYDKISSNLLIQNATGIVLIDEIDKHLHIRMQKDVVPKLMKLFPNVQFIVSSHSPFVAMGLAAETDINTRSQIIDLDSQGLVSDPSITRVFAEAYEAMIAKNEQYKVMYDAIRAKFDSIKLQIVSEGNNAKHIKRAIELLDNTLFPKIEFCVGDKTGWEQLKTTYEAISISNPQAKYLFVFDCDCKASVEQLPENDKFYNFKFAKNDCNDRVKKGIENLYPADLFTKAHYTSREITNDYGETNTIQVFGKGAFLDTVKADTNVEHFANFRPLVEKIKEILAIDEASKNKEKTIHGQDEV